MTNTDQLREQIAVYVAALASSGDNFRVAGELEPISQKVKDDYINSFLLLIERETARARIDELERLHFQEASGFLSGGNMILRQSVVTKRIAALTSPHKRKDDK